MKYLVDTCGWIEWLVDGQLAKSFQRYLVEPELLVVPTSLQYELYKWICRERDETLALEIIGLTESGQVEPLTTSLALNAADLALVHGLSFADAIIYATARQEDVELVTSDSHFQTLPGVNYLQKL